MLLINKNCFPCRKGAPPLTPHRSRELAREVPGWSLAKDEPKLHREYRFQDFARAMKFVTEVANLAESQGHHPDIYIHYNRVTLILWTHAIGGLSENDFILAARINTLPSSQPQ